MFKYLGNQKGRLDHAYLAKLNMLEKAKEDPDVVARLANFLQWYGLCVVDVFDEWLVQRKERGYVIPPLRS